MTLSALIHKNKCKPVATSTVATIASQDTEPLQTVANVAAVTVANHAESNKAQISAADLMCSRESIVVDKCQHFNDNGLQKNQVTCRGCQNFQSLHEHGGGAGVCNAGVIPFGACWWADTIHDCQHYKIGDVTDNSLLRVGILAPHLNGR